jgi:hypothetical protein
VLEDRALELLQQAARLQAQLLPQQLARLPVHRQRVSLPPGPIQREHQLPAQPLLQRVGGDQRLDLPDQLTVGSKRQIGLDPVLQRRPPRILQPCNRSLRERLIRELGKRLSPPSPSAEHSRSFARAASPSASARRSSARSASNRTASTCSGATASRAPALRHDHTAAQRLTQVGDVHLHGLGGGRRGPLAHSSSTRRSVETTSPR